MPRSRSSPRTGSPVRRVVVLGSTGSVGEKALAVVRRFDDQLRVLGLFTNRKVERLAEQVAEFKPAWVAVGDAEAATEFDRSVLPPGTVFRVGEAALSELAGLGEAQIVVNAVVGSAGLAPSLAALQAGTHLALANKESVVLAGELLMKTARVSGAKILPIDSEHSGLLQCLEGRKIEDVSRVILTASGGPFRNHTREELDAVQPRDALNHPVWPMGPRITVDSATLLNKGFEVLEAHWLFGIPVEKIEVLVHPQSVVHALIEMKDGSVIAQLASPDMVLPVQYALSWPERWSPPLPPLDLTRLPALEFSAPDTDRFPGLELAYRAARAGGVMPTVLNAADEVAVEAFLAGELKFMEIPAVLREVMEKAPEGAADSLDRVLEADRLARERTREVIGLLKPV